MTREAANRHNIKFSRKVTELDEEIIKFDSVLKRIHDLMPEDLKVYKAIVLAREHVFHLQQMMHGCEIVNFTSGGTT